MQKMLKTIERRTAIDAVYDELYEDIASLRLLPGAKLSEADIARRFGVSRQPVRDAFTRLENKGLLLIQPQKATLVRGFSMPKIAHARFVRIAVELEVLRAACSVWDIDKSQKLRKNLEEQRAAIAEKDSGAFHRLDYLFHKMICDLSGHPLAFETIEDCKQSIDRLCVLSLDRPDEAAVLIQDHEHMASALENRDAESAVLAARHHFGRLDDTIEEIHRNHAEYFDSVE